MSQDRETSATTPGLFISFEGIDGAGKSSHIEALAQIFRAQGREVMLTREPGGTALAEKLRELLLHEAMDPLTESLLVFGGRRDHLKQMILPAIERGTVVLCDRFTDSTFAYQGGGRGFRMDVLNQLENWVQEGCQPDLTVWFDLPPEVAARRRAAVRAADRFESEDTLFFERVRAGYLARAEAAPDRFVTVNANQPREAVWEELTGLIGKRLTAFRSTSACGLQP